MAEYITKELLDNLGIVVNDQQIGPLLAHLNQTLNERIGTEISDSLSDEKLSELLDVQESADGNDLGKWLGLNVPELKNIVQDEIDIFIGEISENSSTFNQSTDSLS